MFGNNHVDDWRALTDRYRDMGDEELLALAADFNDLTPTAQQVLRDELRLRRLGDPEHVEAAPENSNAPLSLKNPPSGWTPDIAFGASGGFGVPAPELVPDDRDAGKPMTGPVEYTWKTPLCECESDEQAWQIGEALRRSGIESWTDRPNGFSPYGDLDRTAPRVLVAADQLDQARAIIAQPIPQDIVEQSKIAPAEYQPPTCPKCGAADPVLESADPVNAWKCDVCGAEWEDAAPDPAISAPSQSA